MLKAYLHNKVPRALVRREDVVTSCVFGALEASGPEGLDIARRFLALARTQRRPDPLSDMHVAKITYEFWPWLTSPLASAEPDVLITLEHESSRSIIAVEAKLDSGKSSEASETTQIGDQLAREWIALLATAKKRGIPRCTLIYLTADLAPPDDIAESRSELEAKHPEIGRTANILWLSWRDLPDLITPNHSVGLRDMRSFLLEEHLAYFAGFRLPTPIPHPWRFNADQLPQHSSKWNWPLLVPLPEHFQFAVAQVTQAVFNWPTCTVSTLSWRFQT